MSNATAPNAHGPDQSLPRMLSSERASDCAPVGTDLWFHLRHGARGFATGLAIVVPAALWMSGRLDGPVQPPARIPAVVIAPVSVKPVEAPKASLAAPAPTAAPTTQMTLVATAAPAAGLARQSPPVEQPRSDTLRDSSPMARSGDEAAAAVAIPASEPEARLPLASTPTEAAAPAEEMAGRLEAARALVGEGDVLAARAVLAEAALASIPEAAYVIAETYDPNVLAALGITDVRAEVELARLFYERALTGGIDAARQRLEGLR